MVIKKSIFILLLPKIRKKSYRGNGRSKTRRRDGIKVSSYAFVSGRFIKNYRGRTLNEETNYLSFHG